MGNDKLVTKLIDPDGNYTVQSKKDSKKEIDMIVGNGIKREREAQMLSRSVLSEILEISSNYLSNIERGDRGANARDLYLLSHFLKVPVDNFFNYEGAPKPIFELADKYAVDDYTRRRIRMIIRHLHGDKLMHAMYVLEDIAAGKK